MTKKLIIICALLTFPLLVTAQRSRMQAGRTNQHGTNQNGANQSGTIAGVNPAYNPAYNRRTFSNSYGSGYSAGNFYYGPSNGTILGPGFNNGTPSNIMTFVPEQAPQVQATYVPTYMRQDDGPSLAEIAKSLRSARKPAVLVWSNWEISAKQP